MPTYPNTSGVGGLVGTIQQLRKGFPAKVDAGYLQRFGLAPSNESYVITILKFLGLIDEEGNRVEDNTGYFFSDDDAFKAGLEGSIRSAYSQLFDEMGDALTAERAALTNWFRAADKTSDLVGNRQASTFLALAGLAGHGAVPAATVAKKPAASGTPAKKAAAKKAATPPAPTPQKPKDTDLSGVGVTVRIEVNLPPGGDAVTYDAIFASIKKHLMS